MKITDISLHLAKEWRTFLFVEIQTDEGIVGIGESGITSRELAIAGGIEHFKHAVIGKDPFDSQAIWQRLWRGGFYPGGAWAGAAIAAIDMALWDIKGKAIGRPVYQLLGGKCRDRVLTYCHLHGANPAELLASAKERKQAGWRAMRWEPFAQQGGLFDADAAIDRSIDEWQMLHEQLGPNVRLCFDAHTKLSPAQAKRFCRAVESLNPLFVEDPLRSEQPAHYRELRQATSVPLAAGEQFGSKWQFSQLIEERLIDLARVDVCIAGGLTEAQKIAAMCEAHDIDLAVHNPVGPVSSAASLHLNIAMPNVAIQELPRIPTETMPEVFTTDIEWQDGYLQVPQSAGLGIALNSAQLDKYPFEATELPQLYRPDGAFTNW
ncbi:galactonate dehydratase [Neiella marina]|uniref:Galactonate dehydratase n=1 Tax=Neiella marina TaxID=508461 RepID=A0A8J2XN18_9GAMM|nr:galactonate dehydratase [Neiella marina]GGA68384.1 galactonate dehydratase [Neiella marina]